MDISRINKTVKNTPNNINEELEPITDEEIIAIVNSQGDDSNPFDYYTKLEIDSKTNAINSEIGLIKTSVSTVDSKIDTTKAEITASTTASITLANEKIATLEEKAKDITKITYATTEPTNEMGNDGDLWIIYEE